LCEVIIRELDTSDENDLKIYEEALYKAFFFDRRIVEYIDSFYDHKNKRCCLKIPYSRQFIMVAQLGKVIISAVCANFDIELMQIELYGFKVDKNENVCEILHIFNNSGSSGTAIIRKLGNIVLEKIKNNGYKKIYSTCSEYRVRQYDNMGFKIVGVNEIDNEKGYLMLMDILKK
jgi:hypothetical protein